MKIVLASQSPRRHELLKLIVDDFDIKVSQTDEAVNASDAPEAAVMALAFEKAHQVAKSCQEGTLVIGADTLVYCDGFLGKPTSEADAKRMLRLLSGRVHEVLTGYALIEAGTNRKIVDYNCTKVWMKALTESEIDAYVATGEPLDKAGAYGIQGKGALFVQGIEGDFYTVMGLPVCQLNQTINNHFKTR